MKRTLLTLFVTFLGIVLMYGFAHALTGICSNCHTMHNSQNGLDMAKNFDGSLSSTPNPNLTLSTCLGCHNGQVSGAPDIFAPVYGTDMTAGGTFDSGVIGTDDTKVHNVTDLAPVVTYDTEDVNVTGTPGNTGSPLTVGLAELTCAGAKGCHGDHSQVGSAAGIKGFHHAARTIGTRSSKGYRFLQTSTGSAIEGKGSTDSSTGWEKGGAEATDHNVYNADANVSISTLCAQCHGGFHGTANTGSSSPFVRHPTENDIPDAWDAVGAGVTVDYDLNPFALAGAEFTAASISVAYSDDLSTYNPKVACVSCHRAHGSENSDLLRFAYSTQNAGGGTTTTGCLGCHTNQR